MGEWGLDGPEIAMDTSRFGYETGRKESDLSSIFRPKWEKDSGWDRLALSKEEDDEGTGDIEWGSFWERSTR